MSHVYDKEHPVPILKYRASKGEVVNDVDDRWSNGGVDEEEEEQGIGIGREKEATGKRSVKELVKRLLEEVASQINSGQFASIDESIISEKDLSYYGLKLPVILIQGVIYAFFFIGFIYLSYKQAVSDVFLSPYVANASYCNIIPITNNGKFIIDSEGIWEGQPGFNPISSQYEVSFATLNIDEVGWVKVIDAFRNHVEETYKKSITVKDKAWNLVVFSSYNYHVTHGEGTIDIHFTGDATVMFDKYSYNSVGLLKYSATSDNIMTCQPHNAKTYYSVSTSTLNLDIPLFFDNADDDIVLVPLPNGNSVKYHVGPPVHPLSPCPEVIKIEAETDEFTPVDWKTSTIKYDVRSVATAIAINSKILNLESLTEFGQERSFDHLIGGAKSLRMMIDPDYPGMDPILCSFVWEICGILDGKTLRIPILMEGGSYNDLYDNQIYVMGIPHTCPYPIFDCDHLEVFTSDCISMNINIAFVENSDEAYDPISFYETADRLFNTFSRAPTTDIYTLLGYSRGFFSILTSFDPPDDKSSESLLEYNDVLIDLVDTFNSGSYPASSSFATCGDVSYRSAAKTLLKNICNTTNCTWTFIAMAPSKNTYITDYLTEGYRINKQNTFVPFMNSSSRFICEKAIKGMYNPPINLIQSYMTCTKAPLEAFIAAIGIAFSNTTIVTKIIYVILLYVTMKFINLFLHTDKKTQALSIDDKERIYRTTVGILFKDIIENSNNLRENKEIQRLWMLLQSFDDHDDANSHHSDGGAYMNYLALKKLLPLQFNSKSKKKPHLRVATENMMSKLKDQRLLSGQKVFPVDSDNSNINSNSDRNNSNYNNSYRNSDSRSSYNNSSSLTYMNVSSRSADIQDVEDD